MFTSFLNSIGLAPALVFFASTGTAAATSCLVQPFEIAGATSVTVSAMNDLGLATGNFVSGNQPNGAAFVGPNGRTAVLPQPPGAARGSAGVPVPSGINNTGSVIGTYYAGTMVGFTWHSDTYTSFFADGSPGSASAFSPFVASNNNISFNQYIGSGLYQPFAGHQNRPHAINAGNFATVTSVNAGGDVAGEYQPFVGDHIVATVFLGTTTGTAMILPPGAQSSFGGYVNDSLQVAGWYQDTSSAVHGFVYGSQSYQTFNMPTHALSMTVTGLTSNGQVVGVYADAAGQHAFIFKSNAVIALGTWGLHDSVKAAISPRGNFVAISTSLSGSSISRAVVAACGKGF